MVQVPEVPWQKQLEDALEGAKDRAGHRLATLATTRGPESGRLEGRPACRTVNVRKIIDERFYFATDTRSGKADDVENGSSETAELCWWFPECQKQFRLCGTLRLRVGDEMANEMWAAMPPPDRCWWLWPVPGKLLGARMLFTDRPREDVPYNFCVAELEPDYVDVLNLSEVPFQREFYDLKTAEEVAAMAALRVKAGLETPEESRKGPAWEGRRVNP